MSNTWFRLRRGFFLSFFPSDTPHYENVLPDGWCLTDIGELLINRDGERKPVSSVIRSKQTSKIYDYYGAAGVIDKVDSYLFDERLLLIGEDVLIYYQEVKIMHSSQKEDIGSIIMLMCWMLQIKTYLTLSQLLSTQ